MKPPTWNPSDDALDRAVFGLAADPHRKLGDLAVARGFLTPRQLEDCLRRQASDGSAGPPVPFGVLLVSQRLISPAQLIELLQEQQRTSAPSLSGRLPPNLPDEVLQVLEDPQRTCEHYVLVKRIAEGGSGEVWKAWDLDLHRWVALKFLNLDSADALARFVREAQLAARLHHPGIVAVYGIGRRGNDPYIIMQFVDGASVEGRALSVPRSLEIVRDAARAVHAAHRNGVIHRDLKPANLLLDPLGRVYVSDFGLARPVDAPSGTTVEGAILGTPAYMAPEQARGEGDPVTHAVDVYSLGATLFELCVGRPPFVGRNPVEILRDLLTEDPPRPRQINPRLHPDVEAVILKAMAPRPAQRYPTADAFADDIDRFLDGQPIDARPDTSFDRLRRWTSRNRALAAALASVAAVLLVGGVIFALLFARHLRLQARTSAQRAAADLKAVADYQRDERRRRASDAIRPVTQLMNLWETTRLEPTELDAETCTAAIASALEICPDFGPAWIDSGRWAWMEGRFDDAEAGFTRALADPAAAPLAAYYRALIAIKRYEAQWGVQPITLGGHVHIKEMKRSETPEQTRWRESAVGDLVRFRRATSSGTPDPRIAYAEALLALYQSRTAKDYDAAADAMAAALASKRIPAWDGTYALGVARMFSGDFEAARKVFDQTMSLGRPPTPLLIVRANVEMGLATVARMNGKDPTAHFLDAVDRLGRVIEKNPADTSLYSSRGAARALLGDYRFNNQIDALADYEAALADFQYVLDRKPDSAWSHADLAQIYNSLWRVRNRNPGAGLPDLLHSLELLEKAIALDPDEPSFHSLRAQNRLIQVGYHDGTDADVDAAVEDLRFALKGYPDDASVISDLGGAIRLRGQRAYNTGRDPVPDLHDAIDLFDKSIKLWPGAGDANPWVERGAAFYTLALHDIRSGGSGDANLAEADRSYTRAIDLAPRRAPAFANRGMARTHAKRWADALADLRRALELEPHMKPTLEPFIDLCERGLKGDDF